jgi:methylase of polypeptide subunit release factors
VPDSTIFDIRSSEPEHLASRLNSAAFGFGNHPLSRFMPHSAKVAVDIGVGSGAYSSWLASRGIDVHLVDVSQKLLQAAVDRLEHEG